VCSSDLTPMIDPRQPDFSCTPVDPRRPAFEYARRETSAPPVVSVVTPCFNPGDELRETARCVLGQSLQAFEWIIVDDGSTDEHSRALLAELAAMDDRIRVIELGTNRGPSAARNAGIEVDKNTIERAVEYVRTCQNPDGGFRYQLEMGTSAWPRSAAGIATMYYAGIYDDPAIDRGLDYLRATALPGTRRPRRAHYFYGHYYAVQAMYLAGSEHWGAWWPAIRDEMLDAQEGTGAWEDRAVGSAYGTAMALIVLQMPKRYLPIFQK